MSPCEADFVIVGAGSAGCVLANRLSAGGRHRVVMLEAGPRDRSLWIHLPIGYGKTMWDPTVNWKFYTDPDPNMDNRRIYWPRGRCLGGSSSINGLIVVRGQPADYDHWRDLGNSGWGWNDLLPYFVKLESNPDLGANQLHGTGGPLDVSSIRQKDELIEAIIAAAQACGVPRTEDFNGASQEGVGYYQLTTKNGWRASAATAYLRPVQRRSNLTVITGAHATRILLDAGRAAGVAYRSGGEERQIHARAGVILSAGAIQSPQLLMLSGIGPAQHLRDFGIPVVKQVAAVGANLQDHLQVRLIYRCAKPITTNDALRTLSGRMRMGLEWLLFRSGPLAIGINQGGLFTRVLPTSSNARCPVPHRDPECRHGRREGARLFRIHAFRMSAAAAEPGHDQARRRRSGCAAEHPSQLSGERDRPHMRRCCDEIRAAAGVNSALAGAMSRPRSCQALRRPPMRTCLLSRAAMGRRSSIRPGPAAWAPTKIPSSIHVCACAGWSACGSPIARSCPLLCPATPTCLRS